MRTEFKLVLAIAALGSIGLIRLAVGQPILPTVLTPASTATGAGFNIPPGTAPSSPNAGDCWTTSGGAFDCRLNGSTVNLANGGTGATSVSNSDGTLTISPTTGAVVASIALGHANTWSALQTFGTATVSTTLTAPDSATWTSSGILSGTSIIVGTSSALSFTNVTPKLQVAGTTNSTAASGISEWSNDGSVGSYSLLKSRGTSIGTLGAVQAGDNLGLLRGFADDGATSGGLLAAQITFTEQSNASSGSVTGNIFFWTRNGASALANVMQIFMNGGVVVAASGAAADEGAGTLNVQNGYWSGGTQGVSCSGSPTASFASVNGIVTHC